jgi:very-short-patch-repair endonuclease
MANQTARRLRKNETIAEKQLWRELRLLRAQGYHFRRQHPIEEYIVDFACLTQMLIIEVDGIQHDTEDGRRNDAARDAKQKWLGFAVLRFTNGDVANTLDGVVLEVLAALGAMAKQE